MLATRLDILSIDYTYETYFTFLHRKGSINNEKKRKKGAYSDMRLEDITVEIQIFPDEVKKPDDNSLIVLPVQNIALKKNQLLFKWSNQRLQLTQHVINKGVELFSKKWEEVFALYALERAFIERIEDNQVALFVTFDASRLVSKTQIRNIKSNAPILMQNVLSTLSEEYGTPSVSDNDSTADFPSYDGAATTDFTSSLLTTSTVDAKDALNYNRESKIQVDKRVAQVKEEYASKLDAALDENDALKEKIMKYQDAEIDYRQKIQMSNSELLTLQNQVNELKIAVERSSEEWKQKYQRVHYEKEDLKLIISENQKFEEQIQKDLKDKVSELQMLETKHKELEEKYKSELIEWQNQSKLYKNELSELDTQKKSTERLLNKCEKDLSDVTSKLTNLEQDNHMTVLENKKKIEQLKYELSLKEREIEQLTHSKDEEIQKLGRRLEKQQSLVDQLMSMQQQSQTKWQENYALLERSYRAEVDKVFELEKELNHLKSSATGLHLHSNDMILAAPNVQLEDHAYQAHAASAHQEMPVILPEPSVVLPQSEVTSTEEAERESETVAVFETPATKSEPYQYSDDLELSYNEYEYEYEYDLEYDAEYDQAVSDSIYDESDGYYEDDYYEDDYYEDDYYEDDYYEDDYSGYGDYDYSGYDDYGKEDDILGYTAETIQDDVEELLAESNEKSSKIKISKREYKIYNAQLEKLEDRWKKIGKKDQKFKKWAKPIMEDYADFSENLQSLVSKPKLFSPNYKTTDEVWDVVQAYALISRHLQTILDVR